MARSCPKCGSKIGEREARRHLALGMPYGRLCEDCGIWEDVMCAIANDEDPDDDDSLSGCGMH